VPALTPTILSRSRYLICEQHVHEVVRMRCDGEEEGKVERTLVQSKASCGRRVQSSTYD